MQEALVNVAKYAQTNTVTVALARTERELVLIIRDTGRGCEPYARDRAHTGFGLIIMRERMRAMGGRFAIESRPGQGTTVTAALPVQGGT